MNNPKNFVFGTDNEHDTDIKATQKWSSSIENILGIGHVVRQRTIQNRRSELVLSLYDQDICMGSKKAGATNVSENDNSVAFLNKLKEKIAKKET